MKSKFILSIFILTLVIFSSCEYQPTGTNFKEIDSNFVVPPVVILLPEDGRPITIDNYQEYLIQFNMIGDFSKLWKISFYLDTNLVFESLFPAGSFKFPIKATKAIEEYNLKMLILHHSGTGSLADKLNMEGVYQEKNWPVRVLNPDFFKADSVNYSIKEGVLNIEWNKYNYSSFFKYKVKKTVYYDDYKETYVYFPDIYSRDENFLIDNSYVGEKASYSVTLYYYKNNWLETINYPILNLQEDLPVFSIKKISNTSIELNWTKSKYYGSIEELKIANPTFLSGISMGAGDLSKRLDNLPIGVNDKIKINIIPKLKNMSYIPEIELPIVTGDSSFKYAEFETGFGDNIFYTQNIDWYIFNLYKYSISNNSVLQTTSFSTHTTDGDRIKISPNGSNIVYKNGYDLMCCLNGDLNNPKVLTDISLSGKQSSFGFSDMAISNNGILAAYVNDSIYIYNLVKNELICKWQGNVNSYLSISANGDFVAFNTNSQNGLETVIYKISNNTKIFVRDAFYGIKLSFDPNNNSKLCYFDYNEKITKIIDCETNSVINYSFDYFQQIDYESGLATKMKSENNYEIIDLNNGMQSIFEYKSVNYAGQIKGDYIYFITGVKCKFR